MKKLISIFLTAAMLTGNAAMPYTAVAADTAADEVQNTATRETNCKHMKIDELYNLPKKPLNVDIHDYEDFTLEQVLTKLCGGEYAGVSSYGDYYIHQGSDRCFFMDKNGKIHFLHILYPEIVVKLKEGSDIPVADIREELAEKGYKEAPSSISEDRRIFRVYGCTSQPQFEIVLDMLKKIPGAESVTGHIALYEDTVNYASAHDEIRIISPSGTGADGAENKELMDLALSLGFKSGPSADYQGAPIGDYDIIISKVDRHDDTNPYDLFKYLADNGYSYSTSIVTTEMAQTEGLVYFCNIPYQLTKNNNTASDDTPEEIPDLTRGTKIMTLDDVKSLGKKKHKITWSDFAEFAGEWTSTESYSHCCDYELGNGYTLIVRGNPPEKPDMVRLYRYNDPNFIDLRYHNVDTFLNDNFFKSVRDGSEEELKVMFAGKGMTEGKGYRVWTAESASKTIDNYYLSFLIKIPENAANNLSNMQENDEFVQKFSNYLQSIDADICSLCALDGHYCYINEGENTIQYIQIEINGRVGSMFTHDEANKMLAAALNYIQFNEYFVGFEYDSRIPSYSVDDKGTLKGDANHDDQVDMSDVVLVMQSLANPDKYALSEAGKANADINGDGVTVGDAQAIQKRLLGIIDYITDLDTIRKMTTDYCADQKVNFTVVPRDKMPEQFADKYVFVRKYGANQSDYSSFDHYLQKQDIDTSLFKRIPYDINDDSELNSIREKLFCYILESGVRLSVNNTDKEQDAINKKVIISYNWHTPEEDIQKMKGFMEENGISSELVEFRDTGEC